MTSILTTAANTSTRKPTTKTRTETATTFSSTSPASNFIGSNKLTTHQAPLASSTIAVSSTSTSTPFEMVTPIESSTPSLKTERPTTSTSVPGRERSKSTMADEKESKDDQIWDLFDPISEILSGKERDTKQSSDTRRQGNLAQTRATY